MTAEEYINNPSGGRVGGLQREAYKNVMSDRLDKILVRDNNNVPYHCYVGDKGNNYWLYMKVPSEVVKNFHYDVVIRFFKPKTTVSMGGSSLDKYQVQFFSNDPAFVYTHVYVYNKHDLFIKDLSKKMNKLALTHRPTETNVHETLDYCKSIYWALTIAKQRGLFNHLVYTEKFSLKALESQIMPADEKIEARQAKQEEKPEKKEETSSSTTTKSREKKGIGEKINFNKLGTVNFGTPSAGKTGGSKRPNFNKSKKV